MTTRIDQIVAHPNGTLHIRMVKSDGGYHRTVLEPGGDLDVQFAAVNAHLSSMGIAAVEYNGARAVVEATHTPEKVAQFRAARDAASARP